MLQGPLHTEAFSLAGYELGSPLSGEAFGRMHALRILVLDGVEFGEAGVTQPLPKLAHLSWRYGKAARFPFALDAIKSAGVLSVRGVDCLQPLLDGLQVCSRPSVPQHERWPITGLASVYTCCTASPGHSFNSRTRMGSPVDIPLLEFSASLTLNAHCLQVMTQLEELDMSDCMRLEALPATLGLLTKLQRLDVSDCISLTQLPPSLGNLKNLR